MQEGLRGEIEIPPGPLALGLGERSSPYVSLPEAVRTSQGRIKHIFSAKHVSNAISLIALHKKPQSLAASFVLYFFTGILTTTLR